MKWAGRNVRYKGCGYKHPARALALQVLFLSLLVFRVCKWVQLVYVFVGVCKDTVFFVIVDVLVIISCLYGCFCFVLATCDSGRLPCILGKERDGRLPRSGRFPFVWQN